jgi:hypothetical protein
VSRPLLLALTVFVLTVVGVIASAVLLLPDDAPDDTMPSGLTGTPVVDPTPAFPTIPTLPPTPDPTRNVPEVTLFDTSMGTAFPLWQTNLFVPQVEFSADSKWMYFVAFQGRDIDASEVYRIDLGNPQARPEHIDRGFAMRISSRGDLAYIHIRGPGDYIPTVLAADASRHELKAGIGGAAFVWSPDARWLAYSQGYQADQQTYEEYLVDAKTWTQRTYTETLPCNCDSGARPIWSPDGSRFTYVRLTVNGPVSALFDPNTLTMTTAPTNRGRSTHVGMLAPRSWWVTPSNSSFTMLL